MSPPGARLGNQIAPARFLIFLALLPLGFLTYLQLLPGAAWKDAAAMAFDFAAACFLVSLIPILRQCNADAMRLHSASNDANRVIVLVITTVLTLVIMASISGELKGAKSGDSLAMAKLIGTLLLIWLFANTVYTLHYAHAFYAADSATGTDTAGINFPGTKTPDYFDFAYFAFTLGMTFQTSDVAISLPRIRRIALLHCFAGFVFNLGVIAFTINALGGK
jgi:uncharacterized membrane protein